MQGYASSDNDMHSIDRIRHDYPFIDTACNLISRPLVDRIHDKWRYYVMYCKEVK